MAPVILPDTWIVLHFPSGHQKLVQIRPNSTISLGKFGTLVTNQLLYRPYHLTFEILDAPGEAVPTRLRIIPPTELSAELLSSIDAGPGGREADVVEDATPVAKHDDGGVQYDIVGEDGSILIRNNRMTIDDSSRQKLSHDEIEALKRAETGGGKEIITKILKNHSALGEKTDFSLHKYTVRKAKKYLRRFTVYPIDVGSLCNFIHLERDPYRILEIREDTLSLVMSWANIRQNSGKWLVIDDTGGLLVAAIAERLDLLHDPLTEHQTDRDDQISDRLLHRDLQGDAAMIDAPKSDGSSQAGKVTTSDTVNRDIESKPGIPEPRRNHKAKDADHMVATTNTITLLHAAAQPNISLLTHFGFSVEKSQVTHPLYTHLKTLSWLALLSPEDDPALAEPPPLSPTEIGALSAGKKSSYFRKRRRWERLKNVADETRKGDFDGLIVASEGMALDGIMSRLVPLIKGGGQVVAYSPTPESLTKLMDLYSRDRKAAFTRALNGEIEKEDVALESNGIKPTNGTANNPNPTVGEVPASSTFVVNPTLLLSPMMQTVRARQWQVLPGRTHPIMTGKGGAEGYIFSATRVIPVQGRVEARGRFGKAKKKSDDQPSEGGDGPGKRVKLGS